MTWPDESLEAVPLPFKVTDEEGVEWNIRVVATEGEVVLEQYRFEPGKRLMRDVARMSPGDSALLVRAVQHIARKAAEQLVDGVHEL